MNASSPCRSLAASSQNPSHADTSGHLICSCVRIGRRLPWRRPINTQTLSRQCLSAPDKSSQACFHSTLYYLNDFIRQILSVWRRSFPLLTASGQEVVGSCRCRSVGVAQEAAGLRRSVGELPVLVHQLASTVRRLTSDLGRADSLLWDRSVLLIFSDEEG